MEKGERFAPAGGCGGGLERGSELEYVLKSGARKAVLVESSSLLQTLPLQEASECHSPCSSAGLWHNMHRCVLAHRRGASQTIALNPLAVHSHRSSSGGGVHPARSSPWQGSAPAARASRSSLGLCKQLVESHRVSSRCGQADREDEQAGHVRLASQEGLRLPRWSCSWAHGHPSSALMLG